MTLVKILRSGRITLPAELRKLFNLREGDSLEAEATKEGILLKPVASKAGRKKQQHRHT
jgi:AbrB family looped-hinge helix DNA binding protein